MHEVLCSIPITAKKKERKEEKKRKVSCKMKANSKVI
jgi:hypothetical protein